MMTAEIESKIFRFYGEYSIHRLSYILDKF